MKNSFLVIFLASMLIPSITTAAGMQVYPSRIDFDLSPGQQDVKKLTVSNPTADTQLFEASAEGFSQLIKIEPVSFTLESGEKKNIQVSVKSPKSGQTVVAEITLTGKPLTGNSLSIGAGAKIPVVISSIETNTTSKHKPFILGLMILAFLGLVYYLNKKEQSKI